jgi:hypothetical protein
VTGDFNGDGKADLIVAFSPSDPTQPGGVAVLLGKGDGTFQPPANITLPGPIVQQPLGSATAAPLTAGDFNGDGKLDVAVVINGPSSNRVAVLLGNAMGLFTPTQNIGRFKTTMRPGTVVCRAVNRIGKELSLTPSWDRGTQDSYPRPSRNRKEPRRPIPAQRA